MNDLTWVYVVTNPSFPKYVKIGWTRHNPHKRVSDIDSTGVPTPFDLSYVACVENAERLEKLAHQSLDEFRVRSSREFFEVSASFARETVRSVAQDSGVRIYFEKIYDEGRDNILDVPGVSVYDEIDYIDTVNAAYASLVSGAFLALDVLRGCRILIDYCGWYEGVPEVDYVFTAEDISRYRNRVFNEADFNSGALDFSVPDSVISSLLRMAVDEDSVRNLIDWLALAMVPEAQALTVARHYIHNGLSSRVRLLGANYLYEIGTDYEAEALRVYLDNLSVDESTIRQPSKFISFNDVLNQAFVRMCNILMKSNCHEHDNFLRQVLVFLESSQSGFARHYDGLRTVMQCYFDGGCFEGCVPLSRYYRWLTIF